MDPCESTLPRGSAFSDLAKERLQRAREEPWFVADWLDVLMIHFDVERRALQRDTPFDLDLRDRRAFITLVAFTMTRLRPATGGRLTSWLFRPMAIQHFLNVRTYVRAGDETGIHFLAEWVSNRLAVALGPRTFSLPYRLGRFRYHKDNDANKHHGRVEDAVTGDALVYEARLEAGTQCSGCEPGSLDEWLMERYSAFNSVSDRIKSFHVWHEPWRQRRAQVEITTASLLNSNWGWFHRARLAGAQHSPGVRGVWLGRPHRLRESGLTTAAAWTLGAG